MGTSTALPAPVQLPAVAPAPGGVFSVGGLDAADSSVAGVVLIDGSGARDVAKLPLALHDAAAAQIDGQTYMFGGGELARSERIDLRDRVVGRADRRKACRRDLGHHCRDDRAHRVHGRRLHRVGAAAHDRRVHPRRRSEDRRDASTPTCATRPSAAVGGRLLIAGGTSGVTAQRAILSFDPATRTVRQIGELPQPLTHAAGASLNGWFYVLGGRGENLSEQHSSIYAMDPRTGAVRQAGRLPEALSDIGAASLAGRIVAVGGRNSSGTVSAHALTLLPVAR